MKVKIVVHNLPPLYPSTRIEGTLNCTAKSMTQIRSIKIRCYGKEYTEWRGSGWKKPTYYGKHYFFQREVTLFQPNNGSFPTGEHSFFFTFVLPPSLPSTFEFPFGYVRYSLKGIVDMPMAADAEDRVDLDVISILNMRTLPEILKQPSQSQNETMMGCCWLYNTDPVKMEAQINKRAFLAGETIKINMEVNNMSNDYVEELVFKLIRCFAAHSEHPRHVVKYINEDLVQNKYSGVGPHGQQTYDINLVIPKDLPVPNLVECQLLESIYRIEVTGSTSGCNRDINFVIAEIRIGHTDGPFYLQSEGSCYDGRAAPSSAYPYRSSGYPYPTEEKTKKPIGFNAANPTAPPLYTE